MTPHRRLRVLVAEDNSDAALTLDRLVRAFGHESRVAADGLTALREVEEGQADVVLLDIGLPRMNGWEVARRLRDLPARNHLLLIAITGYDSDEDRQRSEEAGIDTHLVKPADPHRLRMMLEAFGHQLGDS